MLLCGAEARPDVVLLAKQMHDQGMSLRKISAELAARGYVTTGGRPYVASSPGSASECSPARRSRACETVTRIQLTDGDLGPTRAGNERLSSGYRGICGTQGHP